MAREYVLSAPADDDLLEIARYTAQTWGLGQMDRYLSDLHEHFERIGRDEAHTATPLPRRSDVQVSRCQHHYVFSRHRSDAKPLIVAVLHENMDLITRLKRRLTAIGVDPNA